MLTGVTSTPHDGDMHTPWGDEAADEKKAAKKAEKGKQKPKMKLKHVQKGGKEWNPLARLKRKMLKPLQNVQVKLGGAASGIEKVSAAVSWLDPVVSRMVVGGIVIGCCVLSLIMYVVGLQRLVFLGGLAQFILPLKKKLTQRLNESKTSKKAEETLIVRLKKPKPAQELMKRIPDLPEMIHRHVCKLQRADEDDILSMMGEPILRSQLDEDANAVGDLHLRQRAKDHGDRVERVLHFVDDGRAAIQALKADGRPGALQFACTHIAMYDCTQALAIALLVVAWRCGAGKVATLCGLVLSRFQPFIDI